MKARLFFSLVLGAAMAFPSIGVAQAINWHRVACTIWVGGNGTSSASPDEAANNGARFRTGVSCDSPTYGCTPVPNVANGVPIGTDFTGYDCFNSQPFCGVHVIAYYDFSGPLGNNRYCLASTIGRNTGGGGGNNKNDCPMCGDPVNALTGNKFQAETDFREGKLEFTRYYNSIDPPEAVLGYRWRHNWERKILSAIVNAEVYRPDGKHATYTAPTSGTLWTHDADVVDELEQLVDGTWKLTTGDNEIEVYSTSGQLTSITSAAGDILTLAYTDGTASGPNGATYDDAPTAPVITGKLLRVTDFRGRSLQFKHNTNGGISKMIDPTGGTYQYTFIGSSIATLSSVTYPSGKTKTYLYNEAGNVTQFSPDALLTGIVDETGVRYSDTKYSGASAISTELAGGVSKYTFNYGPQTFTDPLGTVRTAQKFSPAPIGGELIRLGSLTQPCPGCGPSTATKSFNMDDAANVTSTNDFAGNLTCYSYETPRNLETARTEGLNGVTGTCSARQATTATRTITMEWHPTKRLTKRVAEPLRITSYNYNGEPGVSCAPAGTSTNLLCSKVVQATTDADGSQAFVATADGASRTWTYAYNANGQVTAVDGPRTDVTDVTSFAYYTSDDPAGNYRLGDLLSVTNAAGHVTQYTLYDGAGRLKKSIDPNGLETLLEYWERGWLKTRRVGTTAAGYELTSYDYDDNGSLTKVTTPDGSYVAYTYDTAHRLTKIQDGPGNRIEYTLDNMGNRTAETAYDTTGAVARVHSRTFDVLSRLANDIGGTNPSQQITVNGYDANGNLKTVTDPLSRVTTNVYDNRDRLTQTQDPFNGSASPTSYAYNQRDELTSVIDPSGLATTYTRNGHGELMSQVSPDTGMTTFTYDAASNVKTKLDGRNVQASYIYDALNRVTQITYPDQTVTYSYDSCTNGIGRICSMTDMSGSTSYTYEIHGRVASKTQVIVGLTRTMGYAYNAAGQLVTLTLPSGVQLTYGYSNNRPVSIAASNTTQSKLLDSVVYKPFGPIAGWTWRNSQLTPTIHTRQFDLDYRMTRLTTDLPVSGGQPIFDRQIGWDQQSRVQSITDVANSAFNTTYGYDAVDRLTSATQGANTSTYTYNGTGDRLTSTVNGTTTNYSYFSGTHRLQSLSGAQSRTLAYDGAGNVTADGTTHLIYGGDNRPTAFNWGPQETFYTNALGQRVKRYFGVNAQYHWVFDESGNRIGEYNNAGVNLFEMAWLGDIPVVMWESGDWNYIHTDHLGTPRMITRRRDRALMWNWDNTEPFGNSTANENPAGNNFGSNFTFDFRFPGQYFDIWAPAKINYNYFRDYDPSIGRYLQSDPMGLRGGINTYGYVNGRPLNGVDPFGLDETIWSPGKGRSLWDDGPRNGNWCGGNWSGGLVPSLNGGQDGTAPPLDSLDSCCKVHDDCYGKCDKLAKPLQGSCYNSCNKDLIVCLGKLSSNCSTWPQPPRKGTEGDSQSYRTNAIKVFTYKIEQFEKSQRQTH